MREPILFLGVKYITKRLEVAILIIPCGEITGVRTTGCVP